MSEALFRLRPVAFEYARTLDPGATAQYGLVAEEVSLVMPELVLRDKDGNPETVRYHLLVPLLLNELRRQREVNANQAGELKKLSAQIEALVNRQQEEARRP
jgi:hypothetical protein